MNAIVLTAMFGMLMMFSGAFNTNRQLHKKFATAGIIILLVFNSMELYNGFRIMNIDRLGLLNVTSVSLVFVEVILLCTLFYFLLMGSEVEKVGKHVGDYFALIYFILCGATLCCHYNNILMLFLGIEIMSIPQYVLAASDKGSIKSNEAGLKYFLLGSFSTGILLMGIAFLYGGNPNGSFFINQIQIGVGPMPVLMAIGLVFLLVALSFKVSAAPFHFYTPDVYDGTPTVFTAFISTIAKAAAFFAFVKLFSNAFGRVQDQWQMLIVGITIATLLVGNITAVFQQSVKRMMAYSSIAQAGFMLFAVFAINDRAQEGLLIYAAAYCIASIGFFAILIKLKDYTIDGFNGLGKTQPLLAFCATIFLLSLTGIPLTAGFQAKFIMLLSAADTGNYFWMLIIAVLFAAVSAYYYFRIIQAMYFKPAQLESHVNEENISVGYKITLLAGCLAIIALGIYPELLIGWLYH